MEAYIKKHFWVFNLFLTMLVAYSAAGLANHIALNQIETKLQAQQSSKKPPKKIKVKKKRINWSKSIADRNLFNANPPSKEQELEGKTEGKIDPQAAGAFPQAYDECEDSSISATLKVTMEAYPVEYSHAIIEVNREERIFKVGETIENKEIVGIQWNGSGGRVVLRSTNRYECLKLGKKSKKTPYRPAPAYQSKRNKKRGNKNQRYKDGIKETSPGKYEVDRAMLNEELENLDKVIRQARVIPYYQKGKASGFKVVGVRSNSIFRHLGLKSGDILKSVGGEELKTINQALQLFEKLKSSDQVSLDVQRRGKMNNLEYNIK